MDVLDHILEEHQKFREMASAVESSEGKDKKKLFRQLYAEVKGHHEAEEHVVFPDVKAQVEGEDLELVKEMVEEHSLGGYQFSVLERTSVENDTWDAKFTVLVEVLDHHMEEEEQEFIPLAREALSKSELEPKLQAFDDTMKKYVAEMQKKLKD